MSKPSGPQPTPISVLIKLYSKPNQPPLVIEGIDKIDIKTQIKHLDPDNCDTQNHRNDILRQLNIEDLRNNAYKRIRLKSMLCEYHKHWYKIRNHHFRMIGDWNDRDFALSVIAHFIKNSDDVKANNESDEKEQKRLNVTWRFLDYLTQYFDKKGFNGKEFITKHVPNGQSSSSQIGGGDNKKQSGGGFGLTIVKEVCKQFDQKTGQYTKVKKQLTTWAKKNVERHQQEIKFSLDDIKEDAEIDAFGGNGQGQGQQGGNDEIVDGNDVYHGSGGANAHNPLSGLHRGEKWYWFCDEGGIKWVPYKDEHQKLIEDAWVCHKPFVIIMTKFKIEFHREREEQVASGQQYNYQIHNSWRRGVIRGKPDNNKTINDIPCDQHPR